MGIFETIAIAWLFGINKLREFINSTTTIKIGRWWNVLLKYVCPVAFLVLAASFLYSNIRTPYAGYEQQYLFIGGWVLVIVTFVLALIIPKLTGRKKETGEALS